MKQLLFCLASLLLLASPSLAFEEHEHVGGEKDTTWRSGWGVTDSGARLTYRVADVQTGRITLSYLIPGDDNIVTKEGFRYWSTGEINCKEFSFEYFYVYNTKREKDSGAMTDDLRTMAIEFCGEYQSAFRDTPYFK